MSYIKTFNEFVNESILNEAKQFDMGKLDSPFKFNNDWIELINLIRPRTDKVLKRLGAEYLGNNLYQTKDDISNWPTGQIIASPNMEITNHYKIDIDGKDIGLSISIATLGGSMWLDYKLIDMKNDKRLAMVGGGSASNLKKYTWNELIERFTSDFKKNMSKLIKKYQNK